MERNGMEPIGARADFKITKINLPLFNLFCPLYTIAIALFVDIGYSTARYNPTSRIIPIPI